MSKSKRSIVNHPLYTSPTVTTWRSRIKANTFLSHFYVFRTFMAWKTLNGGELADYTPEQLIAYQKRALGDDRYKIVDLVEAWMMTLHGRAKAKERYLASVKSFFLHNRAELPRDPSFRIVADEPPVVSTLTVEDIRKVVLKSNPLYRAVFLCMLSGGMGCGEVVTWSNTGYQSLRLQLESGTYPIKVALPGRKMARNKRPYYTFLGRDAVNALKLYMKHRPEGCPAIFVNQKGTPISEKILAQYWLRALKKLGLVTEGQGKSIRYGKNPHELRDVFRTRWHKSGADSLCAEFFMGHEIDPLGYNKAMDDEDYTRKEHRKAERWLNVLSDDPTKVDTYLLEDLQQKLENAAKSRESDLVQVREEMRLERKREMAQFIENLRTTFGMNTKPGEVRVLVKSDHSMFLSGKRTEIDRLVDSLKSIGIEVETQVEVG
jgi:integrase